MPATIILSARKAEATMDGRGMSVVFDGKEHFPTRQIECRTAAEAVAARDAYKADAAATGLPLAICMTVKRGDRSPRGFDAANRPFYVAVNL